MPNFKTKYSLNNALIIILGVLTIFLTTLFAPIITKKVHNQIVAHAWVPDITEVSTGGSSTTDTTSTIKIKFKDTLTFTSDQIFDITFKSNNQNFTQFLGQYGKVFTLSYNSTSVYDFINGWLNTAYQVIEIDPTQPNFQTFITAMKSNIDGVELESGTYKWVNSPTSMVTIGSELECAFTFSSNSVNYYGVYYGKTVIGYIGTLGGHSGLQVWQQNGSWRNVAYKTITTSENQYIDYDFYNYAILGNQLVKQTAPTSTHKLTFDSNITITINGSSVTTSPYNLAVGDVITATTSGGYKISINGTLYGGTSTININNQDINIVRSTAETFDVLLVTINYTENVTPTAYSVTYALLNNCTADSTNPTSVESNTNYQFKFNIIDTSYDVTFVTVGNATLVSYTTSNGVITATINNVVGNVSIEVSVATSNTFNIVYTFNDGVLGNDDLPSTISSGQTISGSVITQSGYRFSSITCSNGDFTFDYNSSQTKVDFTLKDVTANTEIVFNAIIPQGTIIADSYKSTLTSAIIPSNNNIGYKLNTLYTINSNFVLYDGFNSINCTSFNMLFREVSNDVIVGAYFNDGSKNYNLFDTSYNWSNVYLKYVTLKDNVNTSLVAQKGFNYIYNTIYTDKTLSSGIYTFKLDNDYYSSSLRVDMPFVYWQNTSFTDVSQIRLLINNGLYYYSSLGSETIVYGADYYVNNNARCFKLLQSVSLNPYVYDTLTNMIESGNNIGIYIGGSYTFTFDNLNNLDTSSFTNFNFQYFKDNYYSQNISVKGFKVVNSQLFYILYDNTEVLVYNGAWVEDYYRYISIIYQNVSDEQYTYLNNVGVFKNLYVGENVTTWRQFFFTIADVPLYIFSRIFYFELFGEQTFIIIYSIVTILIVFKIVSWALKLKD